MNVGGLGCASPALMVHGEAGTDHGDEDAIREESKTGQTKACGAKFNTSVGGCVPDVEVMANALSALLW